MTGSPRNPFDLRRDLNRVLKFVAGLIWSWKWLPEC